MILALGARGPGFKSRTGPQAFSSNTLLSPFMLEQTTSRLPHRSDNKLSYATISAFRFYPSVSTNTAHLTLTMFSLHFFAAELTFTSLTQTNKLHFPSTQHSSTYHLVNANFHYPQRCKSPLSQPCNNHNCTTCACVVKENLHNNYCQWNTWATGTNLSNANVNACKRWYP